VLPVSRRLRVGVTPIAQELTPGQKTRIDVDVKDADGKPATGADVALVVADEAILALAGTPTPDPVATFYAERASEVRELTMRERVVVGQFDFERFASNGGDRDSDGIPDDADRCPGQPENFNGVSDQDGCPEKKGFIKLESSNIRIGHGAITVRHDFSPLAIFSPRLVTDAKGHASAAFRLPDNLTRYRVMAVAAAGAHAFGAAEGSITARLPLMVRPSPPRFLERGDRFEVPVLVQNLTKAPLALGVVMRADGARVVGPWGKRLTVPPNDRAEVRFGAEATNAGQARFQIAAAAGADADASDLTVPVFVPATPEAFATYGVLDDGAIAARMEPPKDVLGDYGGLEVSTSSTALQALSDAVLYLVKYPFACAEQVASRVLSVAALRDVLGALGAEGLPSPAALEASMKGDLEVLAHTQQASGGWSFWGSGEVWPFLSVHVAHALARAREKGYTPDPSTVDAARNYLREIETHWPAAYPDDARRAILAYALYVRKRLGDADPARAKKLVAEAGGVDKLPLEALGWLWPTLADDAAGAALGEAILRQLQNRARETAGAANFTSSYGNASYLLLHSDRRTDAVLLEALVAVRPSDPLIPKVVQGLMDHRTAGRWASTQENVFVLLALARYFEAFEKGDPDFVARVWLGDKLAGEHTFRGRSADRSATFIPMQKLAAGGPGDLVVAKDGSGRLYYRLGLDYAPRAPRPPDDRGFAVARTYEAIEAPSDVTRDASGVWHVRLGAKVRVRVTMVAPSRRTHVALVDHLPAGFEAQNPYLAVTAVSADDSRATDPNAWLARSWYEHDNLRDDRAEAFASLLDEGVHEYAYVARATTPGDFTAPAPKAEEMYAPETFGTGAIERVIVEAR
jgi:uncharacterized protein YfaS (alpha-2-macroglobulin family)